MLTPVCLEYLIICSRFLTSAITHVSFAKTIECTSLDLVFGITSILIVSVMSSESKAPALEHRDSVSRPHSPQADPAEVRPAVICVFCGSSPGKDPVHTEAARSLGQALHEHKIKLVYGAGTTGLMGEVARTLVSLSGPGAVHGIIPTALMKYEQGADGTSNAIQIDEMTHGRITEVPSMHVRKEMMAKEVMEGGPGSGFIALSGGLGTLEELAEVATWHQLGIHNRGVVAYNVKGFWNPLIEWIKNASTSGFIAPGNAGIIAEARSAEDCVLALRDYKVAPGQLNLDVSDTHIQCCSTANV